MQEQIFYDPALTPADRIVLQHLANDIDIRRRNERSASTELNGSSNEDLQALSASQVSDVQKLTSMRNPKDPDFEPVVFLSIDQCADYLPSSVITYIIEPYMSWARHIVRHETDVVMLTHLLLYFTTQLPSAIFLFRNFTYLHGVIHLAMTIYYVGTYTLMMHQHIHQRGILAKKFAFFDRIFPYITDPLMGHSWNGYYYHHVKHHHVEGNGPDDLSTTIRYQRDSLVDFLCYVGRFYFFIWLDLPLYFLRKNRPEMAIQAACSECLTYLFYYVMVTVVNTRATIFVFIIPCMLLRIGLMVGNWGQHALVDPDQPDSDFRSSITLVDVPSNRFCFNDGYHTSHHLNPLRHWRDHPISFLEQKKTYAKEGALVFHNVDFIFITVRLLMKDYETLARCLVPIGSQIDWTMEERVKFLKTLTRKFSDDEIRQKFHVSA